jgi:mono/diheme cytochrome c family protein
LRQLIIAIGIAVAAATSALMLGFAGPALAQSVPGNAQTGQQLSQRLCSTCHIVDRDLTAARPADVPSFPAIADRPGATAELLAGRIIIPHPAMPGVSLTSSELRDILAYILSLKRPN